MLNVSELSRCRTQTTISTVHLALTGLCGHLTPNAPGSKPVHQITTDNLLRRHASCVAAALRMLSPFRILMRPMLASLALATIVGTRSNAHGAIALDSAGHVSLWGDITLRLEDQGPVRAGQIRQQRLRDTIHLGTNATWTALAATVGATTGDRANQHSPTSTLYEHDDSAYGNRDIFLNLWNLTWKQSPLELAAGRMPWPFVSETDYVWDTDINPAGAAVTGRKNVAGIEWSPRAAWFALPDGSLNFHGQLLGAQIAGIRKLTKTSGLTAAFGLFAMDGEPGSRYKSSDDNRRDYRLVQLTLQYATTLAGRPASAGLDLVRNLQSYAGIRDDATATKFANDRGAAGLGLSLGQNKKAGDWRVRYNYGYIEALSVNPAMAQDTLSRLGFSNIRGHDLRLIYSLRDNLVLMPRYMLSDEIVGTAHGFRARLDLTWKL